MSESLFYWSCRCEVWNFIKKETLAQVFSCEFCEIFKNTFSYRAPLVVGSVVISRKIWSLKETRVQAAVMFFSRILWNYEGTRLFWRKVLIVIIFYAIKPSFNVWNIQILSFCGKLFLTQNWRHTISFSLPCRWIQSTFMVLEVLLNKQENLNKLIHFRWNISMNSFQIEIVIRLELLVHCPFT